MVGPHVAEVLFATVAAVDDRPVTQSHGCMAVPDWGAGTLHIWGVPGVGVHIKHGDIVQVGLR